MGALRQFLAAGLLALLSVHAVASPDDERFLPETYPTNTPPAAADYCLRYPEFCRVDLDEPRIVEMTPDFLTLIKLVTAQVNTQLIQQTDQAHWGMVDRWDMAEDGKGDCEEFQLVKRKLLMDAGVPRSAMPMAVVLDHNGLGHAVLVIHTTVGDLVLDNLTSKVFRWKDTGYKFRKLEGMDGQGWVTFIRPGEQATMQMPTSVRR